MTVSDHRRKAAGPDSQPGAGPVQPTQARDSGTERWAAIVVDEPIFDFEPLPPASRSYRPDTVFDGWSVETFTVRLASVRGYAHRYKGLPRQDAAEVAYEPESGAVIFAVADGVSSAPYSDIGASAACQVAVDAIRWQLVTDGDTDFDQVVNVAADTLTREASRLAGHGQPDPAAAEELLGTTLIAGYVVPDELGAAAAVIQIGDSGVWLLHSGRYHPLVPQKHDPRSPVISSAVSPLPRIPGDIRPVEFGFPPDSVLLVGTDGFGDPLGDGDGKVGQLFAEYLATPPPPRALAHLLDFSRETFDDDRTLFALWQQPRQGGASL
jgi:serine/threonine protein phosphatase PrpC